VAVSRNDRGEFFNSLLAARIRGTSGGTLPRRRRTLFQIKDRHNTKGQFRIPQIDI
jgi:hypothetical protein